MMRSRLDAELEILNQSYIGVIHIDRQGEDWFLIPDYQFPEGWEIGGKDIGMAQIAFMLAANYPQGQPYAFLAPNGLTFNGNPPNNTAEASPPFDGKWLQFSWSPEDGDWKPLPDVSKGSNLKTWADSFRKRLAEGV
ncbi:hypothetical protein [uncultured Parasphingorhabdus sp.]|uniref:hypothetical protein n=1 Tax=uncultured Parasphingorhabdus sp. TaxID=2709694 RepID=UPI0030D90578|tara:strand:+ start:2338 stop:2748 length:411 start_codon:yes stop_codon:yes gene_type:complete